MFLRSFMNCPFPDVLEALNPLNPLKVLCFNPLNILKCYNFCGLKHIGFAPLWDDLGATPLFESAMFKASLLAFQCIRCLYPLEYIYIYIYVYIYTHTVVTVVLVSPRVSPRVSRRCHNTHFTLPFDLRSGCRCWMPQCFTMFHPVKSGDELGISTWLVGNPLGWYSAAGTSIGICHSYPWKRLGSRSYWHLDTIRYLK